MSRLSRPLNKAAVRAADDAFYASHHELVKNGTRLPLSNQADLQKEWRKLYIKNGGKVEADKQVPDKKPDAVVQSCPAAKNVVCTANKAGSTIILDGTPDEKKKIEGILDKIRETPSGRELLTDIDKAKNPVTFKLGDAKKSGGGFTSYADGLEAASNGVGSKSSVTLDKDLKDDSIYVFDKDGNKISDPVDVIAAHELTHALHGANGTRDAIERERQAITGENGIRKERSPKLTERDPGNHAGDYN